MYSISIIIGRIKQGTNGILLMIGLTLCAATLNWLLPSYWAYASNSAFALPENTVKSEVADSDPTLIAQDVARVSEDDQGMVMTLGSLLVDIPNPLSNVFPVRDKIVIYKFQKGDTISGIASQFGVSANTILNANPTLRSGKIKIGQEIIILPISGALHQVVAGETIESIAALNEISPEVILQYNKKATVISGESLIIPGGKAVSKKTQSAKTPAGLPSIQGYFVLPAKGKNVGKIHEYNAVDITNACGTPVVASAEGLVSETRNDEGSDGYGKYVLIEHPNGTKTRYANLSKVIISEGDYIAQNKQIGEMGSTGTAHGTTGCYVHFEVIGAKNPFGK